MNTKQGLPEARASLLSTFRAASEDNTARSAIRAHRLRRLHEPTVEEIGAYRKSGGKANIYQVCAESLLRLRGMPMAKGKIERALFAEEVERLLCNSAETKDTEHKERFGELAHSFSRLIAVHYEDEYGRQPGRLDGELKMILPYLAKHLMAELELCMEARFARPASNLCKVSFFDIQAKLDMLGSHPERIVKANDRSIIDAAMNGVNLRLADTLAAGAKAKLDMLEAHPLKAVRINARSILNAALIRGTLRLADTLAAGAAEALRKMEKRLGVGMAKTPFSEMLASGTLDVDAFLKRDT